MKTLLTVCAFLTLVISETHSQDFVEHVQSLFIAPVELANDEALRRVIETTDVGECGTYQVKNRAITIFVRRIEIGLFEATLQTNGIVYTKLTSIVLDPTTGRRDISTFNFRLKDLLPVWDNAYYTDPGKTDTLRFLDIPDKEARSLVMRTQLNDMFSHLKCEAIF